MPYVTKERRKELLTVLPDGPGDLNYLISDMLYEYWLGHKNYRGINDIIGALECAKIEFYRRIVAEYEDAKIKENGDVY
jgi:hypothetical protein